jgi:hypothetical protein
VRVSSFCLFLVTCCAMAGCREAGGSDTDVQPAGGSGGSCSLESDVALCAQEGRECGETTVTDKCGDTRTITCGTCEAPLTCGGGGQPGMCGQDACEPESDQTLCADNGRLCGELTVTDGCGESRTIPCGSCTPPDTCGGGGQPGVCGHGVCDPESDETLCSNLGKECGQVSTVDACGEQRTVVCGTCSVGSSCGAGGTDGVCGSISELTWCTPTASVPAGWSFLDNGTVRVGINLEHGAAVGHFSVAGFNVLDSNDNGRYLQQSYYGDDVGGSWHGEPWNFNPVQGGSSEGDPSPVTEFCSDGKTMYAKTVPLDWGGTGTTPCVMEEWITLMGDLAVLRFRFEYNGTWDNASRHQEVPALFLLRNLEVLTSYEGNAPFTGAAVTKRLPKQLETEGVDYASFDEPWLAYLNASDWGVGLYKKNASFAACYRFGDIGEQSATSYFALVDEFALTPGLVHEYTVYLKVGYLDDLRATFLQLHQLGL